MWVIYTWTNFSFISPFDIRSLRAGAELARWAEEYGVSYRVSYQPAAHQPNYWALGRQPENEEA